MKSVVCIFSIFVLALATLAADDPPRPIAADPPEFDRYQQIVNQNIFIRNRVRPRVQSDENNRPAPPPAPTLSFILRGIVQRGDIKMAFIENARTGELLTLDTDDPLGKGRIGEISLSGIEYLENEKSTTYEIGQTIGQVSSRSSGESWSFGENPPAPDNTSTPATSTQNSSSSGQSEGELSILEKLRLKRSQQLGKE